VDAVLEFIRAFWLPLGGFAGIVAWLVRVDGRTTSNDAAIKDVYDEMSRMDARIGAQRKEDMERIGKSLSTIETDIKTLLSRGH